MELGEEMYGCDNEVMDMDKDIDTNSADTGSCLLSSSQASSSGISEACANEKCFITKGRRKSYCCGPTAALIYGIFLVILGFSSIVWTPHRLLLNERLKMTPGFPPFNWWKNPPDEVLLRVYIFNITNSEEFLRGEHHRLRVQEIGPIVYREKLVHTNITFHENNTLTYIARRTAQYLPEMNTIDLNQTLVLPNVALLGMASYFWNYNFFTKFGFNLLVRRLETQPIVKASIRDYLWNFSDPILDVAQNIAPSLVPVKNMGILHRIYDDFTDEATVHVGTGPNADTNFFTMDRFHGEPYVQGLDCPAASIIGATEGVLYPQLITNKTVPKYWRKTLCKATPLHFSHEVDKYSVTALRFNLPNSSYDRLDNETDCYAGNPAMPSGLSDVSKCYYDFPIAASFPHFLSGDQILNSYVDGLKPNNEKHGSFAIIEPMTGIPVEACARSQSNLVIKKLTGFHHSVTPFSDTIIPMFWVEYYQVGLPYYVRALMYFTVKIVPVGQYFFTTAIFLAGFYLIYFYIRKNIYRNKIPMYSINKAQVFQEQNFIKIFS